MSVSYKYYRFKSFSGLSGFLEISEVQVVDSGVRVSGGILTSSSAPAVGAVDDLNDDGLFTRCYWSSATAQDPAFWLLLSYGAPVAATGYKLGGFDTADRYPTGITVEGSTDLLNWTTLSQASGLVYPGAHTLSSELPLVPPWTISGNIVENSAIVDWRVLAYKCKDGNLSGTSLANGSTYSVPCADSDPCNVLLTPKIDYVWSANKPVAVNDYVVPSNPDGTPHLWKCTAAGDPYYSNVSLLLHCNGSNGSATFTDNSPTPKTVSVFGNSQISTAQSKFGESSVAFDGTGDYLHYDSSTDFDWTGDVTLEAWVYASVLSSGVYAIFGNHNSANDSKFQCYVYADGRIGVGKVGVSETTSAAGVITTGSWIHVAVVQNGATVYVYVNGTAVTSGAASGLVSTGTDVFNIGYFNSSNGNMWNGYMDDIRITKGVARYTGNFTPPTTSFPDGGVTTGSSEPTWNLSGTTTDNTVTWTYVAPLINPVSIGPKIPV